MVCVTQMKHIFFTHSLGLKLTPNYVMLCLHVYISIKNVLVMFTTQPNLFNYGTILMPPQLLFHGFVTRLRCN